ncbi:MAG: DMT family transporter [Burkholderiales bacterium]|nr:DMT family transporter [Burkholderiales bacterium]
MNAEERQNFPASILWLLVALTLGWGFNWPMIKLALTQVPALSFRSACLLGGAAGLFAIAAGSGLRLRPPRGQRGRLLLITFFNITVWNVCVVYGIGYMASGRAAILAFTMPLWGVLLSAWLLNERLTARRVLGVVLGMGAMLLLLSNELQAVQAAPKGTLLMLGAALSWAMGTVMMKRYPVRLPVASFTAWQLLLGGIPIYAGAFAFEMHDLRPLSPGPAAAVAYNILVSFVFCQWAWIKIATTVPVGVSSLSTLMIPVVGVFSGMLVLSEVPRWQDFAALALVLLALATVMLQPGSVRALFRMK